MSVLERLFGRSKASEEAPEEGAATEEATTAEEAQQPAETCPAPQPAGTDADDPVADARDGDRADSLVEDGAATGERDGRGRRRRRRNPPAAVRRGGRRQRGGRRRPHVRNPRGR
ncbi:hypothetical protein C6376_00475 [Streptomyces sp. P3]|nr:hypothetical protein C6376_00475 [Streptomyces sp. P3]